VTHKAYIAVDERGTVAAAATGVGIVLAASRPIPQPPVYFIADHPFLYLIRDAHTGSILFLGRLADPRPHAGPAAPASER